MSRRDRVEGSTRSRSESRTLLSLRRHLHLGAREVSQPARYLLRHISTGTTSSASIRRAISNRAGPARFHFRASQREWTVLLCQARQWSIVTGFVCHLGVSLWLCDIARWARVSPRVTNDQLGEADNAAYPREAVERSPGCVVMKDHTVEVYNAYT